MVSASIHGEREKAPSLFGIRIGDNINTLADLLPAGFERQTDLFGEDISQREDYFSFLKSETGDTVSFFCDIESKEIYEISYSASGLKAEEIDANTYGLTTEEYENRFSALEEFHEDQLVQITSIKSKDEIYGDRTIPLALKITRVHR